ncbi:MAG: hypothetical protein JXP34_07550 [Planctomycetes bacterium]|nr:hypothetical protein [Planctomycetota bacterium]
MEGTTRARHARLIAVLAVMVALSPTCPRATAATCDSTYRIDLVAETEDLAVQALLTSPEVVCGGSFGVGYDPSALLALSVDPLEALQALRGGDGPQFLSVKLQVETDGCSFEDGLTVEWLNGVPIRREDALPAVTREPILRFNFRQSPEGLHGGTTILDPTGCLSEGGATVPIALTIWPEGEPRSMSVQPCTRPAILQIPCDLTLTAIRSERTRFLQRVLMRTEEPVYAGTFGMGYDASVLRVESAVFGSDLEVLNGWTGPELFVVDTEAKPAFCEGRWSGGIACGWINNMNTPPDPIPPGDEIELLRVQFRAAEGTLAGQSSPVDIVDCLLTGLREDPFPVTISLLDHPIVPCVFGTSIEIPGIVEFARGDANADGRVDIGDAVTDLSCLFTWTRCPSCMDALDVNDNGLAELSDAIYLLSHLFVSGPPPAAPFPGCGLDATDDELICEEGPTGCP